MPLRGEREVLPQRSVVRFLKTLAPGLMLASSSVVLQAQSATNPEELYQRVRGRLGNAQLTFRASIVHVALKPRPLAKSAQAALDAMSGRNRCSSLGSPSLPGSILRETSCQQSDDSHGDRKPKDKPKVVPIQAPPLSNGR